MVCYLASVDASQEKLTAYLQKLVSQKTLTSDFEANRQALKWVEAELAPLSLYTRFYEENNHPSLVITTQKTKKPIVWLVAHIDVVSAADTQFCPIIRDKKMYARGAYDMKMAIACYMLLLHELKDELSHLNLGIMLTSDEEMGGFHGVKRLLEKGYSGDIVFLPDGGFNWKFEEAAKGVLHIKIGAKGCAAHGSRPWLGVNAINKLIGVLDKVQALFPQEGSYFPTANIGFIQGGKSVNQVPDYAEAKIDIRYPPSMSASVLYAKIEAIAKEHDQVTLEKIGEGSPHQADLSHAAFQRFRQIAASLYDIKVGSMVAHGSSDARFFAERGIPVLVIAPQGGEIHSAEEWVDLEDLARFYEVLKVWVLESSRAQ